MAVAAIAPTFAYGKLSISKEYLFSPSAIINLENKVKLAFERAAELKEYPVYYSIDSANNISLFCPPHQPDKDGNGCSLSFNLKLPDSASIIIRKKLVVIGKSKEIQNKLSSIDPNTTQEHQQFGSIFDQQDKSASHYFCEPDGQDGSRAWKCLLYVSESIN